MKTQQKGKEGDLKEKMVFIMTIPFSARWGHNYHLSLGTLEHDSFTRKWN